MLNLTYLRAISYSSHDWEIFRILSLQVFQYINVTMPEKLSKKEK